MELMPTIDFILSFYIYFYHRFSTIFTDNKCNVLNGNRQYDSSNPIKTGTNVTASKDSVDTINNGETFLQDFLENLEEMFLRYYMQSNVCSCFKSSTT